MRCTDALEAMLEAAPPELHASGDSPLSRHLRECPRCRSMAQAILEDEALLAHGLASAVPIPDLDSILARGLDADLSSAQGETGPTASRRILRLPWKRAAATLFPLAAAATLAALFLGRSPQLPGDPYYPAPEAPGFGLEVPEGRNVAVLATNNPEITVLWLF